MSDTLAQLRKDLAQVKKSGNEGWLQLELLLYIAEALDDTRHLLKELRDR